MNIFKINISLWDWKSIQNFCLEFDDQNNIPCEYYESIINNNMDTGNDVPKLVKGISG